MASLKKIDDQTWLLVVNSPTSPLGIDALFCATAYPSGDGHHLDVLVFGMKPPPVCSESRFLEIQTELYRTRVWASDVELLMESVAESYHRCLNPAYPTELVYEFGGLVHGSAPSMFVSPELVH